MPDPLIEVVSASVCRCCVAIDRERGEKGVALSGGGGRSEGGRKKKKKKRGFGGG